MGNGPTQTSRIFNSYIAITHKENSTQPDQHYWERGALFNPTHNPEHTTLMELSRGYTDLVQGAWTDSPHSDRTSDSETKETEEAKVDTSRDQSPTQQTNPAQSNANEDKRTRQAPKNHHQTPEQ